MQQYETQLKATLNLLEDLKEQLTKSLNSVLKDIKECQEKLAEYNAIRK